MLKEFRVLEADPSLRPFLSATDETEQERLLGMLISEQAGPLIRDIIRNRLRFRVGGGAISDVPDGDDVYGEVVVGLVRRLRESKANPDAEAIRNFRSYVAVTALNACHDYLRQKYPQRCSLENKLRYLLVRSPEFALWQNETGNWLCGFARWKDEKAKLHRADLINQLREDSRMFLPASVSNAEVGRLKPGGQLAAVFNWAGSPVELGELITIMANLWGIKDTPIESYDGDDQLFEKIADPRLRSDTILELRISLEQLWKEICQLPPRQRAALLLNLRDELGRNIISLIPDTRTAGFQEIAEVLNIPLEQFHLLWPKLPMDDATIAELLGATPRQIIRLRKCARERLTRRMKPARKVDTVALRKGKRV